MLKPKADFQPKKTFKLGFSSVKYYKTVYPYNMTAHHVELEEARAQTVPKDDGYRRNFNYMVIEHM